MDFGDWLSTLCPQAHPYVQNASDCPGQSLDVAATSPEGIDLDVIGYDLVNATAFAPSDFNGDGKSDIVWQNTITGQCVIWMSDGTTVNLPTEPTSWSIAGTGDFNGDGKPDIIWQNTITGQRLIWMSDGTTVNLPTEPASWSIAGTGDFNGDGKPDIIWQNTITGQRLIWMSNGTTVNLPTEPTYWSIVAP
jgi:hypothetical protein